ncbi:MAG: hypothetical protein ACI4CS_08185 [Candidatus Weimeria sp.]
MIKLKSYEMPKRILFTVLVLVIYLAGRCIELYGIASDTGASTGVNAQSLVTMMLSGNGYQRTIMTLGVMPYINASLLVQVFSALKSANSRAKISKQRQNKWMLNVCIVLAVFMSLINTAGISIRADAGPELAVRAVIAAEMFAGAMLTFFLCTTNENRGIGASMPIILINVISTLTGNLSANHFFRYPMLIVASLLVVAATAYLENSLIKLPLQRTSIHNIHADKNYMAYKRNPVGIMPVMFASAAFLVPQFILRLLVLLFPENKGIKHALDEMVMTRPLGIAVYLIIILILAIVFSFIMLSPMESSRQLQKNGDSIIGIPAGNKTRNYLVLLVLRLSIISGLLQAGCMAIFLILSMEKIIPVALAWVPSSAMILVSIICSFIQEIGSYIRYDAYSFFL